MDKAGGSRSCTSCGASLAQDNAERLCAACTRRAADPSAGPPVVPEDFWRVGDMALALRSRHIGLVIAAYRRHPFHHRRISQEMVGGWVGLSQTQLSRLETGPPCKNLDTLTMWARLLDIPADLLWFALPGGPVPTRVHPLMAEPTELGAVFPVLELDELRQLSRAMENARFFDTASVEFLERHLVACTATDGAGGPRSALPHVLGLLATIEHQAGDVQPGLRADFIGLGARAAEVAGWFYRDLGSEPGAEHWRDRAFEWAAEVGDLPMCGYVLLRKSQAAWDGREARKMLALADAAGRDTWRLPARVRAEVAQQQARGHAMVGSSPDLVDRKLEEAWELVKEPANPGELGVNYGPTMLTLQTAICQCEAGDAAAAVETYTSLLADNSFSRRDRGYFLALLALAYEAADEHREAARNAVEAVTIAGASSSHRTLAELRRLDRQLLPWRELPEVRDFREALVGVP